MTSLLRSQVCRSSEEILDTNEQWKATMVEKDGHRGKKHRESVDRKSVS
jgi:hypothetical protein